MSSAFGPAGSFAAGASGPAAAGAEAIDLADGLSVAGVIRSNIPAGIAGGVLVSHSAANEILPSLVAAALSGATTDGVTLDNLVARLSARASLEASFHLAAEANVGASIMDRVLVAWQLLLEDGVAGIGEALGTVTKIAALADALAATGQAVNNVTAFANLVQAITLEGLIRQGFTPDLTDEATLASATAANARLLAAAADALLAADAGVPMVRISAIAADAVEIASPAEALLRANADLADSVIVYVTLRLGDTDYVGWVLNTDALAASQYRTAPYDSYASFKGKDYGAGPNGIDEFGGTTDDGEPIAWSLRTFLTELSTEKFKRVPDVYIGAKASGQLVVKVITIDPGTGVQTEDWYEVQRAPRSAPGTGRAKVGRGLKSSWWAIELVPVKTGAALDGLNSISLRPVILDRRV